MSKYHVVKSGRRFRVENVTTGESASTLMRDWDAAVRLCDNLNIEAEQEQQDPERFDGLS